MREGRKWLSVQRIMNWCINLSTFLLLHLHGHARNPHPPHGQKLNYKKQEWGLRGLFRCSSISNKYKTWNLMLPRNVKSRSNNQCRGFDYQVVDVGFGYRGSIWRDNCMLLSFSLPWPWSLMVRTQWRTSKCSGQVNSFCRSDVFA